jgi:phosphoglycerate dehydrogenase-like enzyme
MNTSHNASRVALITAEIDAPWIERLQQLAPDLHFEQRLGAHIDDIPSELWQQVEVLYGSSALPTPQQAPNLRWVQLYSAGANQIFPSPLSEEVVVTTASGVHAVNISEYVFTMILAWYHRMDNIFAWKEQGAWPANDQLKNVFTPQELRGKTIGIVGYGSINREVARMAKAFGMHVIATARSDDHQDHGFLFPDIGDPTGEIPERYYRYDELQELLKISDVVVIGVPLTPQTTGMFDEAAFKAMKPSAFVVNIARGAVCDEAALIRALEERWIAGAGLDVFEQEPMPSNNPLYKLPNVLMTPHIAGRTPLYNERAATIFAENVQRYLRGEELHNLVDRKLGY